MGSKQTLMAPWHTTTSRHGLDGRVQMRDRGQKGKNMTYDMQLSGACLDLLFVKNKMYMM